MQNITEMLTCCESLGVMTRPLAEAHLTAFECSQLRRSWRETLVVRCTRLVFAVKWHIALRFRRKTSLALSLDAPLVIESSNVRVEGRVASLSNEMLGI